jgi:hypothetical protein
MGKEKAVYARPAADLDEAEIALRAVRRPSFALSVKAPVMRSLMGDHGTSPGS